MSIKSEQILIAVKAAMANGGISVERNAGVPDLVPASGLVILRDGDPGAPDRVLGGFEASYYRHEAEIEIFVQAGSDAARDAAFDTLLSAVRTALYADKTFGGLAFGFESGLPAIQTIPVDGAAPIKAGTIVLAIEYEMNSPLG